MSNNLILSNELITSIKDYDDNKQLLYLSKKCCDEKNAKFTIEIVYIPIKIKENKHQTIDYDENRKLLFKSNIEYILKNINNIDDFDYNNLFEIFLNHLNKNFYLSIIDVMYNSPINIYNNNISCSLEKDFTITENLLTREDQEDKNIKYILSIITINNLFKKINKTKKNIYFLNFNLNNTDKHCVENYKEFNNFLLENLEDIKEKTINNEKLATIKKDYITIRINELLTKIYKNPIYYYYHHLYKKFVNILHDIIKFMGLDLISNNKYLSELKLSEIEINKIKIFIEKLKNKADKYIILSIFKIEK